MYQSSKNAFSSVADQLGMGQSSDVTIWNIEKFINTTEIGQFPFYILLREPVQSAKTISRYSDFVKPCV